MHLTLIFASPGVHKVPEKIWSLASSLFFLFNAQIVSVSVSAYLCSPIALLWLTPSVSLGHQGHSIWSWEYRHGLTCPLPLPWSFCACSTLSCKWEAMGPFSSASISLSRRGWDHFVTAGRGRHWRKEWCRGVGRSSRERMTGDQALWVGAVTLQVQGCFLCRAESVVQEPHPMWMHHFPGEKNAKSSALPNFSLALTSPTQLSKFLQSSLLVHCEQASSALCVTRTLYFLQKKIMYKFSSHCFYCPTSCCPKLYALCISPSHFLS